jgi:hypothetical protein
VPPPASQIVIEDVWGFTVQGHALYGGPRSDSKTFSASPVDISYDDFFLIAPQSSVAFEVSLTASFDWTNGGGNIADLAEADFANDKLGYELMCPGLQLDLLTAPA